MSNIFETYPQGYWSVNEHKYIKKQEALAESLKVNAPVKFHYFDLVWDSFDRNMLGKFSLDSLYKYRAQQLRDSYDYLILYFSGGADSYNVLRSFIDNDIHLDEVCVKWPMAVHNSNSSIYTPNTELKDASNTLSEWDYAIKPVLDEIARTHPEIKIQIVDWLPDVNKKLTVDDFNKVNVWHDLELPIMFSYSPSEQILAQKGKTIGAIYGIDKPNTYFDEVTGNAGIWFTDTCTSMGVPDVFSNTTVELFYWTPELPVLPFEMARVSMLWQLSSKEIFKNSAITRQDIINYKNGIESPEPYKKYQFRHSNLRNVLYTNWTGRFQANKPTENDRRDKQSWLFNHQQLKTYTDSFYGVSKDLGLTPITTAHTKSFIVMENFNQYKNWE